MAVIKLGNQLEPSRSDCDASAWEAGGGGELFCANIKADLGTQGQIHLQSTGKSRKKGGHFLRYPPTFL